MVRFNYIEQGHWHDGYNVGIEDNTTNETYDFGSKELNHKLNTVDTKKINLINRLLILLNELDDENQQLKKEKMGE